MLHLNHSINIKCILCPWHSHPPEIQKIFLTVNNFTALSLWFLSFWLILSSSLNDNCHRFFSKLVQWLFTLTPLNHQKIRAFTLCESRGIMMMMDIFHNWTKLNNIEHFNSDASHLKRAVYKFWIKWSHLTACHKWNGW